MGRRVDLEAVCPALASVLVVVLGVGATCLASRKLRVPLRARCRCGSRAAATGALPTEMTRPYAAQDRRGARWFVGRLLAYIARILRMACAVASSDAVPGSTSERMASS